MDYCVVGETGIKVSELCMGTMSFGDIADKETSKKIFKRCREAGINFFDTADSYSNGRAEEILGECIEGCREDLVLTSKVYNPTREDINARGLSRRHIMEAVEASLKRLGTDYIDFYFCHQFDSRTAIEETLRAMDDLVRQGKILYPAASNWAAWQIEKALGISREKNLARFECIQPMYNLVKKQAEVEILPMAQEENLGVITYSLLGAGLLTGKYNKDNKPPKGRLIDNNMYTRRYSRNFYFEVAQNFIEHARKQGVNPVALAVAWVKSHPGVTAPIIGARNVEQLEDSLATVDINMTEKWRQQISKLSFTPPPATDRLEEIK
ncbi:aldo/keto reductase [Halarsenatibacter silvermanii]|uniref:Predicted oxidoreductase n=1 Tax=Halarsenatibacter silvermanii TaxID=321763 RepID=A0A1G9TE31_9FIRM|nr:aldo/keto reductase [Halarsenatibacter silvermanii]SDM45910.1 Predicted oxidoreductase [Halarsenatibacter silvermanii]